MSSTSSRPDPYSDSLLHSSSESYSEINALNEDTPLQSTPEYVEL